MIVQKFPYVSPNLFLSENIVIVGSSGTLRDSRLGSQIDSYDEVIRFNRAPVIGFEQDVGEKTTLRVTNNHVFNNNDIQNEGYTSQPPDFIKNLTNQ